MEFSGGEGRKKAVWQLLLFTHKCISDDGASKSLFLAKVQNFEERAFREISLLVNVLLILLKKTLFIRNVSHTSFLPDS